MPNYCLKGESAMFTNNALLKLLSMTLLRLTAQ